MTRTIVMLGGLWAVLMPAMLLLVALWSIPARSQDPSPADPGAGEILTSYLEGALAAAESIRQFDVLVRERQDFDAVNGPAGVRADGIMEETGYIGRIVADLDRREAACYLFGAQSTLALAPFAGAAPQTSAFAQARGVALHRDGDNERWVMHSRTFPSRVYDRGWSPDSGNQTPFLEQADIPDFRFLGILGTSPLSQRDAYSSLAARRADVQLAVSMRSQDGILEFTTENRRTAELGIFSYTRVTIDANRRLPVKRSGWARALRPLPDGPPPGIDQLLESAEFEWEERNGIPVPVAIRSRQNSAMQLMGDVKTGYQYRDFDLHWFSINEPLAPEMVDGSVLRDPAKFLAVLDPSKCGATRLVREADRLIDEAAEALKKESPVVSSDSVQETPRPEVPPASKAPAPPGARPSGPPDGANDGG